MEKIRISPVDSLLSKRLINKGDKNCSREALQFNNISRNSCDLDMFIDESSELLSRTLKRKFTELDEIAERLKSRLSKVISADDESCSADCLKDDELSDQFERDINTSCDEDDFDTADFGEASSSHMNWQKEDAFSQQQVDPKLGQAGREVRSIDELLGQLGFDFSRGVSNNSNSKIDSRGAPLSDENKKS